LGEEKMEALIKVENLKKYFPVRKSFFASFFGGEQLFLKAVDDVTFNINKGEIFGLAGESGCGKTTTGRLLVRLTEPTEGKIYFENDDILNLEPKELNEFKRKMQIIFQDPYESLDPRMTILSTVKEPLQIHGVFEGERDEKVEEILETVGLTPPQDFFHRYPHELSGGQRQRVAIARSLILKPKFIVADEPVSMLDMSIRAGILNLMMDLKEKLDLSYLFITHDLSVVNYICTRLAIMYLGRIVEIGPTHKVIEEPAHPYVKALIAAVPDADPTTKLGELPIKGEVPTPIHLPTGCRFSPRCPYAFSKCKKEEPDLFKVSKDHYAACFLLKKK
jgi:peptide/nickel transport system ATP-binding protein